jgi:hypothetical protein
MRTLRLLALLAVLGLDPASPGVRAALPDVDILEAPFPARPEAKPAPPPKSRALHKRRHASSRRETESGPRKTDADRGSDTRRLGPESLGT